MIFLMRRAGVVSPKGGDPQDAEREEVTADPA